MHSYGSTSDYMIEIDDKDGDYVAKESRQI